jgi:hypothetical protein
VWSTPTIVFLIGTLALALCGVFVSSVPTMYASVLIGAWLMPRNVLPVAALWLLVLLPVAYMNIPPVLGRCFTPAVLVIAIWMIRLALAQGMTLLLRMPIRGWLIVAPFLVLLFASALSSERIDLTLAWVAVLIICVVAPALIGQISLDNVLPTVRANFAGIGLFLGVLAAADFFIHFNPWAELVRDDLRIHMWTVFRTKTSLGHPLTTAMVASVALAVCLFPSGATRRWPYWICAVGALVAVVLSVSRGSVFAVGVAAVIGVLSALPRTGQPVARGRGRLISALIAATLFAAAAWSPLLREYNESLGGVSSAALRSSVFDNAMKLIAERPMLGFGPGVSPVVYLDRYNGSLENSALQLVLSMGIPAFLFVLVGFGVVVAVAMMRSRGGVAAGIVAFLVSATGFNVVDNVPPMLALIAPLIVCAVMPQPRHPQQIESRREILDTTRSGPASADRLATHTARASQIS